MNAWTAAVFGFLKENVRVHGLGAANPIAAVADCYSASVLWLVVPAGRTPDTGPRSIGIPR